MKKTKEQIDEFREKIRIGLDLTFKNLLKEKKAKDGEFVFSENGKIKIVKARDIPDQ